MPLRLTQPAPSKSQSAALCPRTSAPPGVDVGEPVRMPPLFEEFQVPESVKVARLSLNVVTLTVTIPAFTDALGLPLILAPALGATAEIEAQDQGAPTVPCDASQS